MRSPSAFSCLFVFSHFADLLVKLVLLSSFTFVLPICLCVLNLQCIVLSGPPYQGAGQELAENYLFFFLPGAMLALII